MAKIRYRVRNWSAYNRALANRYRLEVWLSEDVAWGWYAQPTGRRGRPLLYRDLALTFCLTIRALFDLPLRGGQGLLESVLPELGLRVPDYRVLCRRAATGPGRVRGARLRVFGCFRGRKIPEKLTPVAGEGIVMKRFSSNARGCVASWA